MIGYAADDVAKPSLGVDVVQASGLDERVYDSGAAAAFIRAGEQIVFSSEGQRPHCALGGVVKGYGVRDAALPAGIHPLRRSWMGHRDRGVGSTKRRQAVMTMSCELELLLGRPYDLPGCAASADP